MPPHLQLTLLNVPPAMDATASLPRPQHVILNHLYIQRSSQNANALVVGTTHRSVLPSTAQRVPACRCFRPLATLQLCASLVRVTLLCGYVVYYEAGSAWTAGVAGGCCSDPCPRCTGWLLAPLWSAAQLDWV